LAASFGQLGNGAEAIREADVFIDKAKALLSDLGAIEPESWADYVIARYPFKHEDDAKRLRSGLEKAGIL
jgi:hypothetical protein